MCKMSFVFGNTRENGLWLSLHQLWELAWFSSGSVQPHVELWSLIVQTRTIFQRLTFNFHLRGGRTGTLYSGFSQEEIWWKESETDLSKRRNLLSARAKKFQLEMFKFLPINRIATCSGVNCVSQDHTEYLAGGESGAWETELSKSNRISVDRCQIQI